MRRKFIIIYLFFFSLLMISCHSDKGEDIAEEEETCNCETTVINNINDVIGTIYYIKNHWQISVEVPNTIDCVDHYIPIEELHDQFKTNGTKVLFSGDAYQIKTNKPYYPGTGHEYYCIKLTSIKKVN